jgi:hypothetical protein
MYSLRPNYWLFTSRRGQAPAPAEIYPAGYSGISSMRLAVPTYTGPCVRIRRADTLAEEDFGFAGGVVDEASIATFASGTIPLVSRWYDQESNGFDFRAGLFQDGVFIEGDYPAFIFGSASTLPSIETYRDEVSGRQRGLTMPASSSAGSIQTDGYIDLAHYTVGMVFRASRADVDTGFSLQNTAGGGYYVYTGATSDLGDDIIDPPGVVFGWYTEGYASSASVSVATASVNDNTPSFFLARYNNTAHTIDFTVNAVDVPQVTGVSMLQDDFGVIFGLKSQAYVKHYISENVVYPVQLSDPDYAEVKAALASYVS